MEMRWLLARCRGAVVTELRWLLCARGGVLVRAKICDGRDWSRWLRVAGAVSGVNEEDDGEDGVVMVSVMVVGKGAGTSMVAAGVAGEGGVRDGAVGREKMVALRGCFAFPAGAVSGAMVMQWLEMNSRWCGRMDENKDGSRWWCSLLQR
ncbi:hypothetical protein DEO72_LG1g2125 [Vigna unguiculata]|uniref:Uncharacterized protein n=1 Tax=Vigna unguiculata TaxID=3917 RepID=A0A4D6KLZ3_VIGUN|nr:hypothetical protein DEO72_LG1g2125 [Vigna unguiculata]